MKTRALFFITTLFIAATFYFDMDLGVGTIFFLTAVVFIVAYIDSGSKLSLSLGFQSHKATWLNLAVLAPITGFTILLIYRYILVPSVTKLTGTPIDISAFDALRGDLPMLLSTLVFVWTSAAFGEEIIFRGYLMTRFSKVFGKSTLAIIANIVVFGVFFGCIHAYQGITGQILSGITGAIIATIFHLRKNDLWFCIIVHGAIDTFALTAVYLNIF